ncbi:hypothetical protein Tsubulata_018119 [Turnera subulata]|uniref:Oleosin n=1 Tax=Turnera subulata TaxID=218843 RepID=A0A9Q0JF19_9ROSI|nr:hypothetical protein Tsubulata_018119 [Turnera subulata]
MSDQSRVPVTHEKAPGGSRQAVKFLTAGSIGAALLLLSGLTLTGTVITVVLATPILVIFSPVLVPAAVVTFMVTAGFFFAGGCGIASIMTLLWMYNYVTGKHPIGADKLDYARGKIAEKARDMKERAKEYGHYVQHRAEDATTQTQTS